MKNPFKRRKSRIAPNFRLSLGRNIKRAFSAAVPSLFRANWPTTDADINSEIHWYLEPLRARSRDLAKNDPYVKRWLQLVRQNIVGPRGVGFQSRAKDPDGALDNVANVTIEDAWRDWSKIGNFDVTGKLSRQMAEGLLAIGEARDGEWILRIIRGFPGNRFGYAVQLLEPDRLDIRKNEASDPETGNRVIMGVEVDELSRPVAYHLLQSSRAQTVFPLSIETLRAEEPVRVPASDIIHGFLAEYPEQIRGIPWAHASMTALNDLGGYREAALVNARVGAAKLGFWRTPTGDESPIDEMTADGALFQDAEPGEQRAIPSDWEFEKWEPTYPVGEYPEYNQSVLRSAAAGLGVFYPMLAQDLERVNLSSIRGGLMDDRDAWMTLQNHFVETLYGKLFPDWLRWVLTVGALGRLPVTGFDKFNAPAWLPRRWRSPDPLKDSQSRLLDYGMRARSLREIIQEDGRDPDEVWEEIARDKTKLEQLGIDPTITAAVQLDALTGNDTEQAA